MFIFFKNIKNSIYSPAFYQDVLTKPLGYSMKYFFCLVLLITVIAGTWVSFLIVPPLKSFMKSLEPAILNCYPTALEIVIKKGRVSVNTAEPCIVNLPQQWREFAKEDKIDNILVVDTKNDFNLNRFLEYKTYALLTKDSLVMHDNNKVSMMSLSKVPDFRFNHKFLADIIKIIKPYFTLAVPIVVCGVFAGLYLVIAAAKLCYLIFLAILIWIIAKLKKLPIGYSNSYKVGLHLITLSLLIQMVLYMTGLAGLQFRFLFTIVAVILAIINLRKIQETTQATL